ncbi:MAG TPA: MarR family winged helix-turn-helix transcriptional regulator [Solirubrobacteraceae bacterium]|nr:MarR family winged helix-turn-helix transcriptional regulator [Solirubrobacteraceae bacterium]
MAALERVGQALRVQMWDMAKQHGVSPTQLQVLLRLAGDPPARRRIGVLAAELDVTHPTLSDAVAVLRRKGLVHRDSGSRKAALSLSPRGQALAAELTDWDHRTRHQLADLPTADKRATLRLLLDLIAGLHSRGAITVARMCVTCRFFRRDAHPDPARPHHCALVDAPLGTGELRIDCAEHESRVA